MPEQIELDESLRRLREFLERLLKVLEDLTNYPGGLIPGRHHEAMRTAWTSVAPQFQAVIKQLTGPGANEHKTQLEAMGLVGDQLVFKLSIFDHAHSELRDHWPPAPVSTQTPRPQPPWWKQKFLALLGITLKSGDVILESLGFLPGAHAIKEFKEGCESGLKLGEMFAESTGHSNDPSGPTRSEP